MEEDEDAPSPSPSRSPSQSPSSPSSSPPPSPPTVAVVAGPPNGRPTAATASASPVTVAAPPQQTLTLALPIQHPRPSVSPAAGTTAGGGREDCWSEGATSALVDAWGERYLELSRGNLKQKHWQEVADSVTSRDGYTKTPKTDVQCKNRIDTLKKKYKVEKSKIASGAAPNSSWPFFHRLDLLLGPNHKPAPTPTPHPNPSKIPAGVPIRPPIHPQFPQRHRTPHPPPNQGSKRVRSPPSVSSRSGGEMSPDSSDGLPPEMAMNGKRRRRETGEEEEAEEEEGAGEGEGEGEEGVEERAAGLRELTRAILGFGEVYERVESSKLQQAMEMEKQRMGFARELELQRMQFFMKTQVELSQLKHQHHQGRRRRRRDDAAGASSNHLHHNNSSNSNNSHSTS